jgi:hypothetical protein
MENNTLREELSEWTDWDVAAFALAQSLGLMLPEVRFHLEAKHVFRTDYPVGNALHQILLELVAVGVLENRDEPDDQFRWNHAFVGSWEPQHNQTDGALNE